MNLLRSSVSLFGALNLLAVTASAQTTTTINFDTDGNWVGDGSLTSYANHGYVDGDYSFAGATVLRNATAVQDSVAGALGTYAFRLRDETTSLTFTYNNAATVSAFGFDVRRWDGNPDPSYSVEYSTNSGADWTDTGTTINNASLDDSSNWKTFGHTLASPVSVTSGQFRVRIVRTTGERIMVDNFSLTTAPVPPPTIASPTTGEIAAFTTSYGTPSTKQDFTVTASNLTADLVATAPTGFEVTSDATTWGNTATFTPAVGAVAGTLGVRLAATAPVSGSYNSAVITLTSTGATTVTLTTPAAGSSVSPAALTVTADSVVKAFGQTLASPVVGSTAFTSSALQNSETIDSVTITYGSGAAASDPTDNYPGSVVPSAATGGTFDPTNYAITYVSGDLTVTDDPLVLIDGTLTAMTATYGAASPPQTFTVSGFNLTADMEVTAPAGFEVSLQELTAYGTSVTLTPASGEVAVTTVYVRLAAGSPAGSISAGNVTASSTGADAKTLGVPAGDIDAKMLTITGLTGANKEYDRTAAATLTGTPNLVGVVTGDEADVTLGGTPSAEYAQATVGTGIAITVSGYEISGDKASNYSLIQPVLTGDITPKELTVAGAAVTTKSFDGDNAATITGTLSGVIEPDVVTLIGTGTFANNGPGVGIAVTSTSTLGGADAGNYSLTQPVGLTGTITAAREAFTQWTFEVDTLIPAVGQGTASNFGGTSTGFATGNGGGRGWNTSSYSAQSAGSGTSGVQFAVSTVGWENIVLNFDHRSSSTGSRWAQVDYSLNGGSTWVTGFWNNHDTANGGLAAGLAPNDNFYSFSVDFTSIPGANNNPNFVVRVVSIFSPVAFSDGLGNNFDANAAYHRPRDSGGSIYGTGGTWRFDNVQFSGTEAPFAFVNSTPAAGAVDAPLASAVVLRFNKPATLSADAVTLTDEAMNVLTYTIEGNGEMEVSLIPTVNLPAFQAITVTLDETQITSGTEQLPVTPPFSFTTAAVYDGPQIAVSAPATSTALNALVYTITLTNTDTMAGVGPFDVTFTLPAGTTYAGSQIPSGNVNAVGNTVTVTGAEIGPDTDQILEIAVLPIAGLITLPPGAVRVDLGPAFALSTENLETQVAPASFDPDTLVLYTVGDGTTPINDSATPIRLLEMSTGGVIRQTIELPRSGASALVARGGTTTGGMISLSDDGTTLLVPGYRKAVGGSNPESDSPATTPRVIGALRFDGTLDTSTGLTTVFSGGFRGVTASANLQQIYAIGEGGVHLISELSATATSTLIYDANLRSGLVTGGRLYVSTGSNAASVSNFGLGVGTFSTPLPATLLSSSSDTVGLVSQATGTSQGFVLLDRDPTVTGVDTLYVADNNSNQLDKYSYDGTTWTARGSLSLDPSEAMFGVTGKVVNAEADLYVTTATKLLSLVDTAAFNSDISGNFQTIHTAANNTAFRGVAFAPQPLLPAVASVTPADEAVDVAQSAVIEITFNQEVNAAANAFVIESPAGTPIAYTLSPASGSSSSFTLTPNNPLPDFGVVDIRVNSEFVTSLDGSAMPADFVSEFTVAGTPEPIVITQQPQSQTVAVGDLPSVQFTVGSTGTVQSYQWQYRAPLAADFEDIPGPFGTSQTLAGLGILTGDYRVVLTGPISSVTSQTATLSLTGDARIAAQSGNQLIGLGQPLRLEIFANGTLPRQFSWFRNSRAIAKSNSSIFQVASATRSTGGVYLGTVANALAFDASDPISVGVVTAPARSYFVQPNSRLTFSVRVDGRSDVSFQWFFNGTPMSGQDERTLALSNIQLAEAGEYFCRVSAPGTTPFDGGIQTVAVFNAAPEIDEPVVMPTGMVSAEYGPFLIPVKADDPTNQIFRKPSVFSARGLPSGLRVNPNTGEVSGIPNAAVENRSVTLTASNALGSSNVTVQLTIEPLAGRAIGTFAGIIERNDSLNQGLGGTVDMTVRPTGQFTVAVRQGTKLYRGRGRLIANRDTPETLEIDIDVSRGRNVQPLRLQFKLDADTEVLFDAEVSADGYTAEVDGWRNPWIPTRVNRRPAEAVAGRYNATIGLQVPSSGPSPVGDVNIPQGFGYISFVVSPTTGRLRLSGKLVDGTAVTGSTFVGFGGQVRVFQTMYGAAVRGSLLGQLMIDDLDDADPNNNTLGSETMNWFRPANSASGNRYFNAVEIDLDLDVEGGRYLAPARNVRVLGLTDGQPNAQLNFANATIETATPLQPVGTFPTFSLDLRNRATFLEPETTNPRGVTFSVSSSNGLFRGQITLLTDVEPILRRRVNYQGILVPGNEGAGYFLLDQLPGVGETIRNSPRLSGAVLLTPVPPSLP